MESGIRPCLACLPLIRAQLGGTTPPQAMQNVHNGEGEHFGTGMECVGGFSLSPVDDLGSGQEGHLFVWCPGLPGSFPPDEPRCADSIFGEGVACR